MRPVVFLLVASLLAGCITELPSSTEVDEAPETRPWNEFTHILDVPAGESYAALLLHFNVTDEGRSPGIAYDRSDFPDDAYFRAHAFAVTNENARLGARGSAIGTGTGGVAAGNDEDSYTTLFLFVFHTSRAATLRVAEWGATRDLPFPTTTVNGTWDAQGNASISYYVEGGPGIMAQHNVEVDRTASPAGIPGFGGRITMSASQSSGPGLAIAEGSVGAAAGAGMQRVTWTNGNTRTAFDAPAVDTPTTSVQGYTIVEHVAERTAIGVETTAATALPYIDFTYFTLDFDPATLGIAITEEIGGRLDLPERPG